MKKKAKVTIIVVSAFVGALVVTASVPLIVDAAKTNSLEADYSYLRNAIESLETLGFFERTDI